MSQSPIVPIIYAMDRKTEAIIPETEHNASNICQKRFDLSGQVVWSSV